MYNLVSPVAQRKNIKKIGKMSYRAPETSFLNSKVYLKTTNCGDENKHYYEHMLSDVKVTAKSKKSGM
jgi:hypothetical protein